jgi:hypothetical protein
MNVRVRAPFLQHKPINIHNIITASPRGKALWKKYEVSFSQ